MLDAYEWLIGTRYLRSGHRRGFLSFITGISIAGLALGVAVLLIVMSVMNGFEKELRSRILNVTSHATLTGLQELLPDWRAAQQQARGHAGRHRDGAYMRGGVDAGSGPAVDRRQDARHRSGAGAGTNGLGRRDDQRQAGRPGARQLEHHPRQGAGG